MKRAILGLLASLPAFAAGTCNLAKPVSAGQAPGGGSPLWTATMSCTADASNGSFPATSFAPAIGYYPQLTGATIYQVQINPGSPNPTGGYAFALVNSNMVDELAGAAGNLSANASASFTVGAATPIDGGESLNFTGNSVNSAQTVAILFISIGPPPSSGGTGSLPIFTTAPITCTPNVGPNNFIMVGNATSAVPNWCSAANTYSSPGAGSVGTVTSVSVASCTNFLTCSFGGAPTVTPALTIGLNTQLTNLVFASPNGSTGAPTFRALAASDVPTLNQSTTGNAATATALAAQGTQCSANQAPRGVNASGNSNNCTAFQIPITLTTTGTSGAATFSAGTLNIPQYSASTSVSSFTGDGTFINNSLSTGAVTVTLANAAANSVWGNNTGSSAAPGYQTSITLAGPITAGSGSGLAGISAFQAGTTTLASYTGANALPTNFVGLSAPAAITGQHTYQVPATGSGANQIWLWGAESSGISAATLTDYTLTGMGAVFSSPLSLSGNTVTAPTAVTSSSPGTGIAHFAGSTQAVTSSPVNLGGGSNEISGNLSHTHLNSGTSASSSTFWRGDDTWATPAGGGNVSTSGSPGTGNLVKFTGSTTVSNGDLTNDVTTAGTLAATVVGTGGALLPVSAGLLQTNGSSQIVATTAIPSATTATTQSQHDNTTKVSTTAYTDLAVANAVAGVNPAVAVLAASTANQTGTYSNGASGVGATFTITATGTYSLDGIAINTIGQRVLFKDQSSGFQNGVYTATVVGAVAVSAVFTRALDYNTTADINSTGAIPVQSGTVNTTTSWLLTSTVTTIGTDALTYVQFSINPATIVTAVTASLGITSSGGTTPALNLTSINNNHALCNNSGSTGNPISANCTVTGTGNLVLANGPTFTGAITAGTDNTTAGTVQLANGSAAAHTIWSSGATTTNTIAGFTAVPTTGHVVDCTSASTTCTLHDSGVVTANVVNASAPGVGLGHFAGSTQTLTSSAVVDADVSFTAPAIGAATATTQAADTNSTKVATTAYVDRMKTRALSFSIGDPANSSALTTASVSQTLTVPYACTISAYNLAFSPGDTGTITVKFWKVATGTAIPTSGNSINTSGVSIASGTAIHSTTVTDFTSTTVTANDMIAMAVTAVATTKSITGVLQCDQ